MRKRIYLEGSLNNWLRWLGKWKCHQKKKKMNSANNRFSFYLLLVFQCRLDMMVNLKEKSGSKTKFDRNYLGKVCNKKWRLLKVWCLGNSHLKLIVRAYLIVEIEFSWKRTRKKWSLTSHRGKKGFQEERNSGGYHRKIQKIRGKKSIR